MKSGIKDIIISIMMLLFLGGMGCRLFFRNPDAYSYSERRALQQKPDLSMETVLDGSYEKAFDTYVLEQFPLRDTFRMVKALNENYVFHKADNNGLFIRDGYLSKNEYPLRESMVSHASERFRHIYDKYLKEKGITPYLAIVPDKNYYLANDNGILTMDYEAFYKKVLKETSYMNYIEIRNLLEKEDYYYTDTHWRQEKIVDVAEFLGEQMGVNVKASYEEVTLDEPFEGVYKGQAALPVKADKLTYLTNDTLKNCKVTCYDTGKGVEKQIYDMEKLSGKDLYEVFLSGAVAVLTIDNPYATSGKELVMFRDSFGSSLAPLLVEGYEKITLIDIRYISSDMLGGFVAFDNQDVLFMYSTLLLNNSMGMK